MINPLRRTFAEGRAALGYLVSMASVQMVQALARTGADWLMIDTEHAPIGIESVAAMIAATAGTTVTPLVRVGGTRPEMVKPALDCGALGAVFPQVATREEAEAAVRAVRYAPDGERGYGPSYAAMRWGVSNLDYLKAANEAVLAIALIESRVGVDALDDILKVRGLDVVAIARGDLSQSLGVAGQFDHPRLREVVGEAERKILARSDVVLGSDAGLVSGAAQRMLQAIKETP